MTVRIRKVRTNCDADDFAVKIHLFRNTSGAVCGWYVGPLSMTREGVAIPYLPRSKQTRASVAVVRAIAEARDRRASVCLVDPEDLWDPAWNAA